ncbi:FGGY-family carbohydrate kinase [Streptomyces lomondensis]|uniref:Carbohydrate kinase n=1 Tax=Streptomyces lomondensis TaxID=68229 RepID=A0ABQ2WVG1_9ACTN|nr:FGGY-family carbohydrate kinase [Streptomyces lomondensis]MCF0082974.1 carbohydrate kinase [Streptomyces lomondensis]GGW80087.1 carbohydrate kinase [Streptomyces lomondensis]
MADEGAGWLGVDLGTQSVRVLLVTADGTVLGSGSAPLSGRREGVRHEQDPVRWWQALCTASRAALGSAPPGTPVGGLAVCGTSGTVLLTDGSGRPVSPALMYDDGRAKAEAARAREAGLAVQDTWALPKALWLVGEYGPGLRLSHQPDLIVTRLTGAPPPADSSHALKTGYDLEHDTWPEAAPARLGLPDGLLPDVVPPGTRLGEVSPAAADATGIPAGTPVLAGMTDGCAAQIASGALRPGAWNSVLGTTLVLKGAARDPVRDPTGVVYNHRAPDGTWLPGGASSVGAGALAAHFPDADPAGMDERARAFEPAGAVAYPLVSPGERFPFRAPEATSLLLGDPADDAERWAALLQGVGFAERLCLDYLHHLGAPLDGPLTFTGGGARSPYWNQLRADILGRPARVPEQTEPALGMAALAAYGVSGAESLADVAERMVRVRTVVEPRPDRTAAFAEPYARLVDALRERGWLPAPVADHARARLHLDTGKS